jgi:biopolymer transport protein TolR
MAAVRSRRGGRGRRLVSEINVVPYIDVMLVLLVIFMVTAPLVPPGQIDLPRAGKSNVRPDAYVEIQVSAAGSLTLRTVNSGDGQTRTVARRELSDSLKDLRGNADLPVMISADKSVKYETVMDVMNELQKQNVAKVGLAVTPAR